MSFSTALFNFRKWIIIGLCFSSDPRWGEIKSFGVFDFVAQGVQLYVARRNRAQKKRKHLTSCRNPKGFLTHGHGER